MRRTVLSVALGLGLISVASAGAQPMTWRPSVDASGRLTLGDCTERGGMYPQAHANARGELAGIYAYCDGAQVRPLVWYPAKHEWDEPKSERLAAYQSSARVNVVPEGPSAAVHVYAAVVLEVVDGDSFHVRVDLGLETERRLEVRVRDLFAPEKNTLEGKIVTAAAIELLSAHGNRVLLRTVKVGPQQRDDKSFARYVCEVWLPTGERYGEALHKRITWTDNGIGGAKR